MANLYTRAINELEKFHYMPPPGRMRTDAIARALAYLGNPHLEYERAQVIGTNGKGATAFYLAAIIDAHGVKTGLYTSPHLLSWRERFMVAGREITEAEFGALYFGLEPVFKKFHLTQFERLTLMAAEFFRRQGVRLAVFETGLGGTGDAVTALAAPLLVYTAITPEHRDILGPTIKHISTAKAGPLAGAREAFSCAQPYKTTTAILRAAAIRSGVKLEFSAPPKTVKTTRAGVSFEFGGGVCRLPMFGEKTAVNADLALRVSRHILGKKFSFVLARRALARAVWKGRLELVRYPACNPVLVSCAHNDASLDADLAAIKQMVICGVVPRFNVRVLFGVSGGRDSRKFLKKVAAVFTDITVTRVPGSEAAFEKIRNAVGVRVEPDCVAATHKTIGPGAERGATVIVIGSIYLAGAVMAAAGGPAVPTE